MNTAIELDKLSQALNEASVVAEEHLVQIHLQTASQAVIEMRANTDRVLFSNSTTPLMPSGTNEETLHTYTVPARTLGKDGDILKIVAFGSLGGTNAITRTLKLKFGGSTILTYLSDGLNGNTWYLEAFIKRTSVAGQTTFARTQFGTHNIGQETFNLTKDLLTDLDIVLTGQNTSSNPSSIVGSQFTVELIPS